MRYDQFIEGVIEKAEKYYPLLFNSSKQELYKRILELGAGPLLALADKLTEWKWYTPRVFKVLGVVGATTAIIPVVFIMRRLHMLNKDGIKATYAVVYITSEYRGKFQNCNDNIEKINNLTEEALHDLLSKM